MLETIDPVALKRIQAETGNKEKEPKCIFCLVSKLLFWHVIRVSYSLEVVAQLSVGSGASQLASELSMQKSATCLILLHQDNTLVLKASRTTNLKDPYLPSKSHCP